MNTEFIQQGAPASMALLKAVLLYGGAGYGNEDYLATVHDVENGSLLPGTPIDQSSLSDLVAKLSGQAQSGRALLPERVLYSDASLLMWWCPAARRPIYFKSGKADIDEFSGTEVLHPPLVFLARFQSLCALALGQDARPQEDTPLFTAPYFNLNDGGGMCAGNVRLPESLVATAQNLEAWEKAFFETNFTHSNLGGGSLTNFKGGHNALWRAMASPEATFCPKSLVAGKLTLGALLSKGGFR